MNQLYIVIGWVVVGAFIITFFVTVLGLIKKVVIPSKYMAVLFSKLIIEIIAAFFFLFYKVAGTSEREFYIKGIVSNLTKTDEIIQEVFPEFADIGHFYTKEPLPDVRSGKYNMAWIFLPEEKRNSFILIFRHQFTRNQIDSTKDISLNFPSLKSSSEIKKKETKIWDDPLEKKFEINLDSINYAPGQHVRLSYKPNPNKKQIGQVEIIFPDETRRALPWIDQNQLTYLSPPKRSQILTWQKNNLLNVAYAEGLPDLDFKKDGSYDTEIGYTLRKWLGGEDYNLQRYAREILIKNSSRSFRFIIESLKTEPTYIDFAREYDQEILIYNIARVIKFLEMEIKDIPPEVYWTLGDSYTKLSQFSTALEFYEKTDSSSPFDAVSYWYRGYAHFNQFQYHEALENIQNLSEFESYQDVPAVLNLKGAIFFKLDRYDEAIAEFKKSLGANSPAENKSAFHNLGVIYGFQNRFAEAVIQYNKAIQLDPTHAPSYEGLAWVEAKREGGNLDIAMTLIDRSFALDPEYGEAYNTKGLILYKKGKVAEAKAYLKFSQNKPGVNLKLLREHLELVNSYLESDYHRIEVIVEEEKEFKEFSSGASYTITGGTCNQENINVYKCKAPVIEEFPVITLIGSNLQSRITATFYEFDSENNNINSHKVECGPIGDSCSITYRTALSNIRE